MYGFDGCKKVNGAVAGRMILRGQKIVSRTFREIAIAVAQVLKVANI